MDNKIKILLPNERGVTSENVDLFLNLDLNLQFSEFKKERFDNDFDLAAQFVKERNQSRDFIVYGEIDSTVIDCVDVQIRVYSDPEHTDLINIITTSKLSYDVDNVFGKKKGKYYIKLSNYPHESVYFKILSNNFSYRDQTWSQKLIFRDADNNLVPYGTRTVDINLDGNTVQIENDFPFFFNKHWIRLNYNFIEEKKSKISFNTNVQIVPEGTTGTVDILLDKPSPFGLEIATIFMREESGASDFIIVDAFSQPNSGVDIIFSTPSSVSEFPNKASFIVQIPINKIGLIQAGQQLRILNGSYSGYYTILSSSSITIGSTPDLYLIVTSADYNALGTNAVPMSLRVGTMPDFSFEMNNTPVDFPLTTYWSINERVKTISFTANTDFEIELNEPVLLEIRDPLNVVRGRYPETKIIFENATPRKYVQLFLGSSHENYIHFTGRTFSISDVIQSNTMQGPSILRNGYRFENRNEEFYPSAGYTLKIKNEGARTIFPANPNFRVYEDSPFAAGATKTFQVNTQFIGSERHKIKITFPVNLLVGTEVLNFPESSSQLFYSINGKRTYAITRGYLFFKQMITGTQFDWWAQYGIEKPFDYQLNDEDLSVVLTSKYSGIKVDFVTNDPDIVVTTLTEFVEKAQVEQTMLLLANSQDGTEALYSFSIEKLGYRRLLIPTTPMLANETPAPHYLTTGYNYILRPYYDDLQQPYYGSSSTIDDQGLVYNQIDTAQPSYMPRGSAIINGIALLAEGIIPGSKENLTRYGLGEDQFLAGFLPQRIQPLIGTYEAIAQVPSRKIIDLTIPQDALYGGVYFRGFDFAFGSSEDETVFRFYGIGPEFRSNAQWWWTNDVPTRDANDVFLPTATLQERLDTGNAGSSIAVGPIYGTLLDNTTIRMTAKVEAYDFNISNLIHDSEIDEANYISFETVVPYVIAGDVNPSNNGLGGFVVVL